MPAITGISESTKMGLKEYLERQRPRLTQVQWVEQHYNNDLKEEKKKEQAKNAKHS